MAGTKKKKKTEDDETLTYEYRSRLSGDVTVDVRRPECEQRRPSNTDHRLRKHEYHHVRTVAEPAAQIAHVAGVHLLRPVRTSHAHIIARRRVAAQSASGARVCLCQQMGQHEHHRADALHARAEADPRRNAPTGAEVADEDGGAERSELDRRDDESRRRAADLEPFLDRRDDAAHVTRDQRAGHDGEHAAEEREALDVQAPVEGGASPEVAPRVVVRGLRDVTAVRCHHVAVRAVALHQRRLVVDLVGVDRGGATVAVVRRRHASLVLSHVPIQCLPLVTSSWQE